MTCLGCGGTGTRWDKEKNDWGNDKCTRCDGTGERE